MSVVIYIFALAAYCVVGFGLSAFGFVARMDAPTTWPSVVWAAFVVALWATGLWFGTAAYF